MKRLVRKGHEVTLFTSEYSGCNNDEDIDGVRVIRRGNRFSVYSEGKKYYRRSNERYDVVIDEINTIPFKTPLYINRGENIVVLIHQLAREFWYYELPYPMAWVGYHFLEYKWLKKYTNITTITVSESTAKELRALGFQNIGIVKNGLNVEPLSKPSEKTKWPSMVFVGRMKKAKRPSDVIEAYRDLLKKWPELRLTMIGDGYCKEKLQKENPDVEFLGFVDQGTRDSYVKQSWVIAVPGIREGWGQVVTDSNALGTPAVGYNIPGLRDSIKDGFNGIRTEANPRSLADGLDKVLSDPVLRTSMSDNAIEWSNQFSWDKSAGEFEALLLKKTGV